MTYRVIVQPRAGRDIRTAAHWLRERSKSPSIALRWARGIQAKIATLAANPQRCPIDPDSVAYGEEIRLLIYGERNGRYRILFAIRGDAVHIITVRHTAQRSLAEELEGDLDEDDPFH